MGDAHGLLDAGPAGGLAHAAGNAAVGQWLANLEAMAGDDGVADNMAPWFADLDAVAGDNAVADNMAPWVADLDALDGVDAAPMPL